MARPKASDLGCLAERAQADLAALDNGKAVLKLRAIVAVSAHPFETAAEILGVTVQSICNWIKAYRAGGLERLYPKAKRPKPSKLSEEQKAQALKWLDAAKTPGGRHAHWTLEKLRQAFIDEFGTELSINAIWVWLRKEGKKLKVPRPKHYKADEAAQEEFKKKLPRSRKTTRTP